MDNGDRELSQYELLRLEKLKRNHEVLKSLNLLNKVTVPKNKPKLAAKRKEIVPKPKRTRRSGRLAGGKTELQELTGDEHGVRTIVGGSSPTNNNKEEEEDNEEEERSPSPEFTYDPSRVLQYSAVSHSPGPSITPPKKSPLKDKTLSPSKTSTGNHVSLQEYDSVNDSALARAYAICLHDQMDVLAAGGHGGRVSVFSAIPKTSDEDRLLLSFKAARGWISGLGFVPDMACGLLVSSNDGVVSLFDCSLEQKKQPKQIFQNDDLHSKGIYDMDLLGDKVLTGSKDGSLLCSQLTNSTMKEVHRFSSAHSGDVVKSVMFNLVNPNLCASGGNDHQVTIWDLRTNKSAVTMTSKSNRCVNAVRWNPQNEYVLLSASFTNFMELRDTRFPKADPRVLVGHFPVGVASCPLIYQPCFINDGKHIMASGGKSKHLAIFDSSTGEVQSAGYVGWHAGAVTASSNGAKLMVSHDKEVSFFNVV